MPFRETVQPFIGRHAPMIKHILSGCYPVFLDSCLISIDVLCLDLLLRSLPSSLPRLGWRRRGAGGRRGFPKNS
jgi:hypothetical protein